MKILKIALVLSFFLGFYAPSIGQTNYWSHHSLDYPVYSLLKNINGIFYAASDTSILKSTDNGISWEVIYRTPDPCFAWTRLSLYSNKNYFPHDKFVVRQRNGSYTCTDVPPRLSIDGGNTWTELNTTGSGDINDLAINSFGDIYIVADSNLYKTSDDGIIWNIVTIPVDGKIKLLEIDTLNNIYISKRTTTYDPFTFSSDWIYRSTNFGQDWDLILSSTVNFPGSGYNYIFCISNGDLFGSSSWGTQHYSNGYQDIYPFDYCISAHIIPQDDIFLSNPPNDLNRGIYMSSDNGSTWQSTSSGLNLLGTYSIVSDSLGYLFTSTDEGIFKSNFTSYRIYDGTTVEMEDTRINDTTYKQITIFNPFTFEISIDSITSAQNEFFIPEQPIQVIPPQDSVNIQLAFSPTEIGDFTSYFTFHFGNIKAKVDITGSSPRPFLISNRTFAFGRINIGESIQDTLAVTSRSINTLVIDSLFLTDNLVFGFEDLNLPQSLEVDDTLNIVLTFAPDTIGFLRDSLIFLINAFNDTHSVRLFGIGESVNNIVRNHILLTQFNLSQNYPNPFNPTTTISYQIPETGFVTLKVYDVLGNEVATLVNEEKPLGKHQVSFDAKGLSSGIYFYQLKSKYSTMSKKMIYLK